MPTSTYPPQGPLTAVTADAHFHAVAAFSGVASLCAFSISHHTAGLNGLQPLSIDAVAAKQLHTNLFSLGIESVVVSTCNRTELYWRARTSADAEAVSTALANAIDVSAATL